MRSQWKGVEDKVSLYDRLALQSLRMKVNMTLNTWAFSLNIPHAEIIDVDYQDKLRRLSLFFFSFKFSLQI